MELGGLANSRSAVTTRDWGLATGMLLCYITDRRQFHGSGSEQRRLLLDKISEAARCRVDIIQLREKDLSTRELEVLAREAVHAIREARERETQPPETRLLINSRADVALAAGADGVHLRSEDVSAAEIRALWHKAAGAARASCTIGVSCHTAAAVRLAQAQGADFAVFAPVFEKAGNLGVGLRSLRAACPGTASAAGPEASPGREFPVLGLGGVTLENAPACVQAGAAGVAAIRLFQDNDVSVVVAQLRGVAAAREGT